MPRNRRFTEHLDPAVCPKRLLALDGGGLRGVLTSGRLHEIERRRRRRHGDDWCLEHLGERFEAGAVEGLNGLNALDDTRQIPERDCLGRVIGQRLIEDKHFPATFDLVVT